MRSEAPLRELFPFRAGAAVVRVREDGDAAARGEEARDLDVLRVHQLDEVLHDGVHDVLVEIAVAAEAEQIELQALGLHHADVRHVADADFREVGLAGDGAQGGELRAVEAYPVVVVGMLVLEGFQHFGRVVLAVGRFVAQALEGFGIAPHTMLPPLRLPSGARRSPRSGAGRCTPGCPRP